MVKLNNTDSGMIANNIRPSAPIHPGELLKDELEYRGVTQKSFAEKIGVPAPVLNDVLNGKRQISTEYAMLIEAATGIDASLWLKLQAEYNMHKAESNPDFMSRLKRIRNIAAL